MTAPVGADIESICTKCGDVWHVVVAKVGERIVKVLCKQCNGQHRYKAPVGAVAAPKAAGVRVRNPSAASSPKAPRPAAGRARRPSTPPEPAVAADPSRPVRPYRATESFTPGDRITHTSFGSGVVQSSPGPGKIQVHFADGPRILAAAKAASTLERPTRRDDTGEG